MKRYILAGLLAGLFLGVFLVVTRFDDAFADEEYPNCAGWINRGCCCTNFCCEEVKPNTVEQVDADHWRVIATGQVIKRTGWSEDGRFMRCACDFIDGKWTIHEKAYTRCIYPPLPSS